MYMTHFLRYAAQFCDLHSFDYGIIAVPLVPQQHSNVFRRIPGTQGFDELSFRITPRLLYKHTVTRGEIMANGDALYEQYCTPNPDRDLKVGAFVLIKAGSVSVLISVRC